MTSIHHREKIVPKGIDRCNWYSCHVSESISLEQLRLEMKRFGKTADRSIAISKEFYSP